MNRKESGWMENSLDYHAHRVVISSTKSSWQLLTGEILEGLVLRPVLFTALLMVWLTGQRALSGSFQITPKEAVGREALAIQEAAAAVQRDSTDWRTGQTTK